MYIIATTTASILRGSSVDTYGDSTDTNAVVATGIIASIRETSRLVTDPSTQEPRIVRLTQATLPSGTDVRDTDNIRDDTYGVTYQIQSVTQNRAPGFTPDLELELKRVT